MRRQGIGLENDGGYHSEVPRSPDESEQLLQRNTLMATRSGARYLYSISSVPTQVPVLCIPNYTHQGRRGGSRGQGPGGTSTVVQQYCTRIVRSYSPSNYRGFKIWV